MPVDQLFVYGTLKSTFDNEFSHLLRSEAKWSGEAYLFGQIYELHGYPGLILSNNRSDKVYGEIFTNISESLWTVLDNYEGYFPDNIEKSDYIREEVEVYTSTSSSIVQTYVYLKPVLSENLILSGKY